MPDSPICIDLGVFAHNEAANITQTLKALLAQDILADPAFDVRIFVVANACTDQTVALAQQAAKGHAAVTVCDFPQGGKSRNMHRFIHQLARPQAGLIGCIDADIDLPDPSALRRMAENMHARPDLHAFVSKPVKDVVFGQARAGLIGRMIAAGGGGLTDYRNAICGQLFLLRANVARGLVLPIGLPVEDGFIRAMIVTDHLSQAENLDRIDGQDDIFHVYASIQSLPELLRHQTRLVVGSAVNTALFSMIRREGPTPDRARALLQPGTTDAAWLGHVLRHELPARGYGYVPFEFLLHRVQGGKLRAALRRGPKAALITLAGLALDAVVFLRANLRMITGRAAGHW